MGIQYADLVGRRMTDLLDEPSRSDLERGLARFIERRHWTGTVPLRKKNGDQIFYFDCVLNAIVNDNEVVGASALVRNVTEAREKERRFTELFETLQEGIYISNPEGALLDANASLVQMLGYERKEELLTLAPNALNLDAAKPPGAGAVPVTREANEPVKYRYAGKMARREYSLIPREQSGILPGKSSATKARWST